MAKLTPANQTSVQFGGITANFTGELIVVLCKFKVCKSVHHPTFQINHPTGCNNFSSLLLDVYVQLNMFRASSRPSSGAKKLQ